MTFSELDKKKPPYWISSDQIGNQGYYLIWKENDLGHEGDYVFARRGVLNFKAQLSDGTVQFPYSLTLPKEEEGWDLMREKIDLEGCTKEFDELVPRLFEQLFGRLRK